MAEFCLDCYNDLEQTNFNTSDVELSKYPDYCEGCGKYKKVVEGLKRRSIYDLSKMQK